jgi:hypothetical protein
MFMKHPAKVLVMLSGFLLAGCSTGNMFPAAGNDPIKVESVPTGADVYVMGEKIGVTPLMINRKDVFPNTYPSEKVSVYGRITLRKQGCADLTRTVSAEISNNGLHAKLDCPDTNPASSASPRNSQTVEQRLDRVKQLLDKGSISEDEAKQARERILREL